MEEKTKECSTRDIGEAAALYTLRKKFLRIDRESPIHSYYRFVFQEDGECNKLLHEYWSKELLVNAKNYYDSLKTLRNLLWDIKEGDRRDAVGGHP